MVHFLQTLSPNTFSFSILATLKMASSALFQPIRVGRMSLEHRVVLSPMTRLRANKHHVHGDLALEFYTQRASTPGTLLITEATAIHPHAAGLPHIPYIYTDEQINAWRRVRSWFLRRFFEHRLLTYVVRYRLRMPFTRRVHSFTLNSGLSVHPPHLKFSKPRAQVRASSQSVHRLSKPLVPASCLENLPSRRSRTTSSGSRGQQRSP